MIPELFPERIGEGWSRVDVLRRAGPVDLDQLLGILYWEEAQHDGIEEAEDRGVCANAESERKNCDARDDGSAAENAQRVADVLQEIFEEADAAGVAALFLNLFGAAESKAGAANGFFAGGPGAHILFDLLFEVKAKLVVHFGFDGLATEQNPQAVEKIREHNGSLCRLQNLRDGGGQLAPGALFRFELLPAAGSEVVVFCAAVVVRRAPMSLDPAAALEAVKRGIKRALLNAEHIAGDLLDAFGDGPAVLGTQGESAEDE